jgi:hypothetical protein
MDDLVKEIVRELGQDAEWMRARHARTPIGSAIASEGGCILDKTEDGWRLVTGLLDLRTALACANAGLKVEVDE